MELQRRSAPSKQLLAREQAFPHTCHTGLDETCWYQNAEPLRMQSLGNSESVGVDYIMF